MRPRIKADRAMIATIKENSRDVSRTELARMAGVSLSTLVRIIKDYKIDAPSKRNPHGWGAYSKKVMSTRKGYFNVNALGNWLTGHREANEHFKF